LTPIDKYSGLDPLGYNGRTLQHSKVL